MKEKRFRGRYTNPIYGKHSACPGLHRRPHIHTKIICLFWILTGSLFGAFEGADLFRTTVTGVDGIFPPAMNNPARLPDQPIWLSMGRGQPLGRSWAAFNSVSLGGRVKTWRGAAGVWSSGDELYRETSLTAALAKRIPNRFTAGFSLAYHRVTIKGFDPIEGELLVGAALTAPLTERLEVDVWYAGQTLGRARAYESMARQLFQLAVTSRIDAHYTWTLAVEKTPRYSLRQLAEINLVTRREMALQLGYRTAPGVPYLGLQVPIRRLRLLVRVNYHPIFGLSTAFGFAFQ